MPSVVSRVRRYGEVKKWRVSSGAEEIAQAPAGFVGLRPAIGGELDSVVGNGLVDFAVLWRGEVG